jgi:hypothetical protein
MSLFRPGPVSAPNVEPNASGMSPFGFQFLAANDKAMTEIEIDRVGSSIIRRSSRTNLIAPDSDADSGAKSQPPGDESAERLNG